jgi:hypothetical protein
MIARRAQTPELDRYLQAKQKLHLLSSDPTVAEFLAASPQMQATPIYEEAAALKAERDELQDRLTQAQARYRDEQSLRAAEERELEYLRKVNNKELRKGLEDSGVLVQHGD